MDPLENEQREDGGAATATADAGSAGDAPPVTPVTINKPAEGGGKYEGTIGAGAEQAAAVNGPTYVATNPHTAQEYIEAFGDTGARWFCEGKPFSKATAEFVGLLQARHQQAMEAKDKQLADKDAAHKADSEKQAAELVDLKTRLDAAPRGGESVSYSPSDGENAAATDGLDEKVGPNMAKVARSMKLPAGGPPKQKK